jgi:hypothetical protein
MRANGDLTMPNITAVFGNGWRWLDNRFPSGVL